MNELALFAGIGGGILGTQLLGHRCVCAVENDPHAQSVLLARQNDGLLPAFPVWDDITTFDGRPWKGIIDMVSGGFPCQAFSTAAHGKNNAINLWPEMLRIVRDIRPGCVFAENVTEVAIAQAGIDLFTEGYAVAYAKVCASDLGADHDRERWWLCAYSDLCGELLRPVNAKTLVLQELQTSVWSSEPDRSRVSYGDTDRLDRIKRTGNAQVPAVARFAFEYLTDKLRSHLTDGEADGRKPRLT